MLLVKVLPIVVKAELLWSSQGVAYTLAFTLSSVTYLASSFPANNSAQVSSAEPRSRDSDSEMEVNRSLRFWDEE